MSKQCNLFFAVVSGFILSTNCIAKTSQEALFLKQLKKQNYQLTESVKRSFINSTKQQVQKELSNSKIQIPDQLFKWIDSDPIIQKTVYGADKNSVGIVKHLYALYLDLGEKQFKRYPQFMLAQAVVHAKWKKDANISPRQPLKLTIGGDPRIPVDTTDPNRQLDKNDHIINFLNSHKITKEEIVGHELPKLEYDERGIAIKQKKKAKKIPIKKMVTRTLYAADVIASRELQIKFNDYMKRKGFPTEIDCGDNVVHWKSRDGVRGEQKKKINAAYMLFRTAYEEKGLLPKARDPFPTPSEVAAFTIRNHEHKFPEGIVRNWPRYPLNAPWPTLVMLAENNQPLREREERWVAFRDKNIFKTYGEYIGGIAQQHDMQSARRLKPYPFTYHTIQMMLKDGGVCGTMGNIAARTNTSMGIPSTTAGQPGHCAVVAYRYDKKTDTYACKGGQYATGGDAATTPHSGWYFTELQLRQKNKKTPRLVPVRKKMVYHQSVAWAINYNYNTFVDSLIADKICDLLPVNQQQKLLLKTLEVNPYCFAVIDRLQKNATTPDEQITIWQKFEQIMANLPSKPGCPKTGLFNTTVKENMFRHIVQQPIPSNEASVKKIHQYLLNQNCNNYDLLAKYYVKIVGLEKLQSKLLIEWKEHLGATRQRSGKENDNATTIMSKKIIAGTNLIKHRKEKQQWLKKVYSLLKGNEKYVGNKYIVKSHPALKFVSRGAKIKLSTEVELMTPYIDRALNETSNYFNGKRTVKSGRIQSAKINGLLKSIKDQDQKAATIARLKKLATNKETFEEKKKKKVRKVPDPCAATIQKL